MRIEYDPVKNARNMAERGLSFDDAVRFDFDTVLYALDDRKDYGERRIRALGLVGARVHSLVFVETATGIRVIRASLKIDLLFSGGVKNDLEILMYWHIHSGFSVIFAYPENQNL